MSNVKVWRIVSTWTGRFTNHSQQIVALQRGRTLQSLIECLQADDPCWWNLKERGVRARQIQVPEHLWRLFTNRHKRKRPVCVPKRMSSGCYLIAASKAPNWAVRDRIASNIQQGKF